MMFKVLILLVAIVVVPIKGDDEKYTSKYDSVDYKAILASDRLLKNYFNCLMDRGPCTPDGKELRTVLPDALQTDCSKCNEKQKQAAKEIANHIMNNKHDMWDELEAKYDPDGIYKQKYKEGWLNGST